MTVDVNFINPFIEATVNVLQTMAGIEPKAGKPFLKKGKQSTGDVTGLIGLVGGGKKGSFAVSFEENCIKKIVSNLLGEEVTKMDGDVLDAVGEVTNMISGGARAKLSEIGIDLDMAIPTIISGKGHELTQITEYPVIVVPFETEAGSFFVEACLK